MPVSVLPSLHQILTHESNKEQIHKHRPRSPFIALFVVGCGQANRTPFAGSSAIPAAFPADSFASTTLIIQQAGILIDADSAAMVTAERAGSATSGTWVFDHISAFQDYPCITAFALSVPRCEPYPDAHNVEQRQAISNLLPSSVLESVLELSPQAGDQSSCRLSQYLWCVR